MQSDSRVSLLDRGRLYTIIIYQELSVNPLFRMAIWTAIRQRNLANTKSSDHHGAKSLIG